MPLDGEDRKRLALEFLEVMSTRDTDAVLARMSEAPGWTFFSQTFPGPEGVRAILQASSELYQPDSHTRTIHAIYADGETVIVKTSLRAVTFKGEDYENLYILILHFEGDRIRHVEEFMDTAYGNEKFAGWTMGA